MIEKINNIKKDFEKDLDSAKGTDFQSLRIKYLGKKSELSAVLKSLGKLEASERKSVGAQANILSREIQNILDEKEQSMGNSDDVSPIDVTAPGRKYEIGHIHPVNQAIADICDIFVSMGYEIADGPEIEDDWHNFEALNMDKDHPARDMQDTFYLTDGNLPRTHTSSVQIRYMESNKPPIRIIVPGKVHRSENEDVTHSWIFNQIEGLVVDKGITFADLKGTLDLVAKQIFGPDTKTRFRANFFPYTEPSAEMDASCPMCKGEGCRLCSGTGWIELLGSGMVHPNVLRKMGIDPEVYSGFAFGVGADRVAMIKREINDIRYLWHPDVRFLEQF